jgi:membrane protein YqaA with SNARE-associated domain
MPIVGLRSTLTGWMSSRHALPAIFVASLLEMTLVPIPLELALIPAMLASPARRWLAATSAWLGCLVGAALWYVLGALAFEAVRPYAIDAFGGHGEIAEYERQIRDHGFAFVFLTGVTPVPFQIACVVAGLAKFALPTFFVAAGAARAVRYFGLAAAVTAVGDRVRVFMLERPWALGALLVVAGMALYGIGVGVQAATQM